MGQVQPLQVHGGCGGALNTTALQLACHCSTPQTEKRFCKVLAPRCPHHTQPATGRMHHRTACAAMQLLSWYRTLPQPSLHCLIPT